MNEWIIHGNRFGTMYLKGSVTEARKVANATDASFYTYDGENILHQAAFIMANASMFTKDAG